MQRVFLAGMTAILAVAPLSAHAADTPSADSLWNEPQGLSIDSALYVFQGWFDNTQISNDPTQRGFDELSRANSDLLNAYTLLQHAHQAGPQPVPVIDPLLANAYDAVTGSTQKAPLAELFTSINQGLLTLEGRGSIDDQVTGLLQQSRAMQAAGLRDLESKGTSYDSLIASNAQREADFLTQVARVSTPEDGLAPLLAGAALQATTVAHHQSLSALARLASDERHGNGNGHGIANAYGHGTGKGHGTGHGQPQGGGNSSEATMTGSKK